MPEVISVDQTRSGFNLEMGFELVDWAPGLARSRLRLDPRHMNSQGIVHGGVYCAFLDFSCGLCGVYPITAESPRTCMTLSLTTNFLSPARGGILYGLARRTGGGRKIYYAEASITDADGQTLATAMGTFKYGSKNSGERRN